MMTLRVMSSLSEAGSRSINVRTLAQYLTKDLRQKDYRAEACVLLQFTRDQIRYVRDMQTVEVLQTPDITLQVKSGDCDDKSILLAALLKSIGHRPRFVALSILPGVFSHVWVQTYIYGEWVDLEPTEAIPCGERVPTGRDLDLITLPA